MAGTSARSLGNALGKPAKSFVDMPLALADGLHAVPKPYGEKGTEREAITDFKYGEIVTGKSFVTGFASGVSGFITEPYKDGMKEGALGAAKGFGKGSLGLFTKTGAASMGLLAYPGQGAVKSLYESWHAGTRHAEAHCWTTYLRRSVLA